jgi:hypothetical protein
MTFRWCWPKLNVYRPADGRPRVVANRYGCDLIGVAAVAFGRVWSLRWKTSRRSVGPWEATLNEWGDINTAMDAAAEVGRDDGHEEPEPTVIDPTSVVIMLDVTEVPPRAPYDGKSMMLTVHHGSRVTVSLDRDTGQILSVVTFGPEPTDNVQTEYPTQKEQ